MESLNKGSVLEIGAGEGDFINSLGTSYESLGMEFPKAKIKNKKIFKTDFLKWKTKKKFNAVLFWESLEHVRQPQMFLKKANELLKSEGMVFIEIPILDSFESLIFRKYWSHLDIPRHLTHFTYSGLKKMLRDSGFLILKEENVPAFEYSVWGFSESVFNFFGIKSTDYVKKNGSLIFFVFLLPMFMVALIVEVVFYFINESPINLVIAKKND